MRRSGSHPMMANEATPRARRRARGSRTRLGGFACALLLLLALPGASRAVDIGLSDFGALVEIDASEDLAEVAWGFESGPWVTQLLFLSGVEVEPMDLELADVQVTDTNSFFDQSPDMAVLTYEHPDGDVGMQISLLLRGVPMVLGMTDLAETIFVWNETEDTVYFNQIVITSLLGDPEGDVFVYPTEPGNTNRVRVVDGVAVFEVPPREQGQEPQPGPGARHRRAGGPRPHRAGDSGATTRPGGLIPLELALEVELD